MENLDTASTVESGNLNGGLAGVTADVPEVTQDVTPDKVEAPDPAKAPRRDIIADAMKRAQDGTLDEFRRGRRGQHAAAQPRNEVGKFAPGKPAVSGGEKPVQQGVQAAVQQSAAPKLPQPQVAAPVAQPGQVNGNSRPLPQSWEAKFAKDWETLPEHIQAQIEKRENDAYRGLEQYKERAAFAKDVQQALQPYMQTIQQLGATPVQAIQRLFNADHVLRNATPAQKQQYWVQIAREYGVPLNDQEMQQAASSYQAAPPALAQEINNLRQQLAQVQQMTEQAQMTPYMSEIQQFAAQPGHEHFEVLRPIMAAMLEQAASENRPMTLQQAYDEAKWANPQVREALLNEQRQQQQTAQRQVVQNARQAAVQVRGAPSAALPQTIDPKDRRAFIAAQLRAATNN